MQWLPRDEVLTFEEIERVARLLRRALRRSTASASPAASPPSGPTCRAGREAGRAWASTSPSPPTAPPCGLLADDLRAPPACAGSTSRSTRCGPTASPSSPGATRSPQVLDGIDAALEAGLRPGEDQRGASCAASTTTRSSTSPPSAASGASSVRFIEFMPLDADGGWARRPGRRPRPRSSSAIDAVFPLEPVRAGREPGRAVPLPRRRRRGRRDRQRHPAVLRHLRPGPAHRRRPAPQLPVRLDETDLRALLRAGGTDDDLAAAIERRRRRPSGPATRSARCTFVRPAPLDEPDRRLTGRTRRRRSSPRLRAMSDRGLTHLDPLGRARMVDVTPKEPTHRRAVARGRVLHAARDHVAGRPRRRHQGRRAGRGPGGRHPGGQAHRRPHPAVPPAAGGLGARELPHRGRPTSRSRRQVDTVDRTGVEMEALTACSVAALTIYDMCKSADRVDGDRRARPVGEDRRPLGHLPPGPRPGV